MLSLHLESSILINRPFAEFPRSFSDPRSLAAWDASVAEVVPISEGPLRVGSTFETVAPAKPGHAGRRSSYRVVQFDERVNRVELINSKLFRSAVWTFTFADDPAGTRTTCAVDATVRPQYFFVALVLRLQKRALLGDLRRLKSAVEQSAPPAGVP